MGRVLVIGRPGARDLRHRPVQAALPPRLAGGPPADRARLQALARAPGVTGHSGPYPAAAAVLRARGYTVGLMAEARDRGPAPVDQPKVLAGSWVRPRGSSPPTAPPSRPNPVRCHCRRSSAGDRGWHPHRAGRAGHDHRPDPQRDQRPAHSHRHRAGAPTRRNRTAVTVGALGLLGALTGTAIAYLTAISWFRHAAVIASTAPAAELAAIPTGLPLSAATGGWLFAGRQPGVIARQPLE